MSQAFGLFGFPKDRAKEIDKILTDDLVNRQSITIRDGGALGLDTARRFLYVEGTTAAVAKARELAAAAGATEVTGTDAQRARDAIRAQEDSSAVGVGMVFDV